MSQADTSSLDSILNHITRRLSKYSKAVALPQSPHEAVLQMLENLKTLIEIGEAPGISFRRDVSKKALYVEYPNREPSEQLTGETLDDFINRIATSKENRADLIKSYRYFDAVVTMTSMSSAISALRPYRM